MDDPVYQRRVAILKGKSVLLLLNITLFSLGFLPKWDWKCAVLGTAGPWSVGPKVWITQRMIQFFLDFVSLAGCSNEEFQIQNTLFGISTFARPIWFMELLATLLWLEEELALAAVLYFACCVLSCHVLLKWNGLKKFNYSYMFIVELPFKGRLCFMTFMCLLCMQETIPLLVHIPLLMHMVISIGLASVLLCLLLLNQDSMLIFLYGIHFCCLLSGPRSSQLPLCTFINGIIGCVLLASAIFHFGKTRKLFQPFEEQADYHEYW